jgi:hypothetical protein
MKVAVSLMLAALIVLLAAPVASAGMFRDVPMDSWMYKSLDSFTDRGIVEGYARFYPPYVFTRYEFGMVIARIWTKLENEKVMELVDEDTALQLLALTAEFRPELTEIGVDMNVLKPQIARLADEKLFVPAIGE